MKKDHYYSGLEGLCRGLSQLSALDGAEPMLPSIFARDIFHGAERFDSAPNVSRTWRLVPRRRASQFVLAWTADANRPQVKKALATYANRELCALYEQDALDRCVRAMVEGGDPLEDGTEDPIVLRDLLELLPSPLASLRDVVIPAIADGFATERYDHAGVNAFRRDFDQLLDGFVCLSKPALQVILARLLAAVVYGPTHRLALSAASFATMRPDDDPLPIEPATGTELLLVQVYDARTAQVGTSLGFTDECAMFVGRSSDPSRYLERLDALEGESAMARHIRSKDPRIFRIPDDNCVVSNCHGVVFHNGSAWMYYHFDPVNGTVISSDGGCQPVDSLCVLAPGDRIVLGADAPYGVLGATLLLAERFA